MNLNNRQNETPDEPEQDQSQRPVPEIHVVLHIVEPGLAGRPQGAEAQDEQPMEQPQRQIPDQSSFFSHFAPLPIARKTRGQL